MIEFTGYIRQKVNGKWLIIFQRPPKIRVKGDEIGKEIGEP